LSLVDRGVRVAGRGDRDPARAALSVVVAGQASVVALPIALAQTVWPARPIRMIVPQSAVNGPEMKTLLAAEGAEPVGSSPEAFAAQIRTGIARRAQVVKAAGIRPN